jgi:hypothetical protein
MSEELREQIINELESPPVTGRTKEYAGTVDFTKLSNRILALIKEAGYIKPSPASVEEIARISTPLVKSYVLSYIHNLSQLEVEVKRNLDELVRRVLLLRRPELTHTNVTDDHKHGCLLEDKTIRCDDGRPCDKDCFHPEWCSRGSK